MGGFKAQRSHVTALAWASLAAPSSPPTASDNRHTLQQQQHLQPQDKLLLFTGSSDGCVRLHGQLVEALGRVEVQGAGVLLGGNPMQLHKTLHEVDLRGVTCLSVKPADASRLQTGKLAAS